MAMAGIFNAKRLTGIVLGCLVLLLTEPVMSSLSWEFAVTTPTEINFFTKNWTLTTTGAHQFDQLSAIAYDETNEMIYFNDQAHQNSTIFSLKLSTHRYNHEVEEVLAKMKDENVQGLAFDPVDRMLYWTDSVNNYIYTVNVDNHETPKILIKLDSSKSPQGIALDVCRRKIYWTNAKYMSASIERASLNGSNREILINTNISMPSGIVVDQYSDRIYWVDSFSGNKYTVESAMLNGSDRIQLVNAYYNMPTSLTVDEEFVYWTDIMYDAVWRVPKNEIDGKPQNVSSLRKPKAIIAKSNLLTIESNNSECHAIIEKIQSAMSSGNTSNNEQSPSDAAVANENQKICLNGGKVDALSGKCICAKEFKGVYCEVSICHNYCIEGICEVTSMGYPRCSCYEGYAGERCERELCNGYCLNGGQCSLERQEPICHCPSAYHGRRCESMNIKSICQNYCENIEFENEDEFNLPELCGNCTTLDIVIAEKVQHEPMFDNTCSNGLNKTAAFVTGGVVLSLALTYLIIKTLRHHYKPLRPKIKKTFVVRKSIPKTPMTCRPSATEQCEITIEDCCNMNICDTPCFDPKAIQNEISRKEDKKSLVNNMEGDLY